MNIEITNNTIQIPTEMEYGTAFYDTDDDIAVLISGSTAVVFTGLSIMVFNKGCPWWEENANRPSRLFDGTICLNFSE